MIEWSCQKCTYMYVGIWIENWKTDQSTFLMLYYNRIIGIRMASDIVKRVMTKCIWLKLISSNFLSWFFWFLGLIDYPYEDSSNAWTNPPIDQSLVTQCWIFRAPSSSMQLYIPITSWELYSCLYITVYTIHYAIALYIINGQI